MMTKYFPPFFVFAVLLALSVLPREVNAQLDGSENRLINQPLDISSDFLDYKSKYYFANHLSSFNPETGEGEITYQAYTYFSNLLFNQEFHTLKRADPDVFPGEAYPESPTHPFPISFVSPTTVRIQAQSGVVAYEPRESMMLVDGAPSVSDAWEYQRIEDGHKYVSSAGYSVVIQIDPWKIEFYDPGGTLLTHTLNQSETYELPFSFVRRASDHSRRFNAAMALSPGEKIYGGGESFTQLNKRGQKLVLAISDPLAVQNEKMYKPIPFFLSNRGYGIFMHTTSPITADIGKSINNKNALMIGDSELDMFFFLGEPQSVLNEYTNLTGKAAMPPLWSFGFWMSRITYTSEAEGRNIAAQLRRHKIPSDVIHFDTGWFEHDWQCDYQFAPSRFDDPEQMISDFRDDGFHISLWQIPYFIPANDLFPEIIENDLYVSNNKGNLPTRDAILDFSNPETVEWYQGKIGGLLEMGVGAIKADFGEAAPYDGLYASGRTGFYEHNAYPLRYNKAVSDITKEVTGDRIIWARSAWAGSQRYPVHWAGDAATTNSGMAATLRGGLSLGTSGFSFWSHDMGGFKGRSPKNLYKRWAAFGMLTSHSRAHGIPPTEPWEYDEDFLTSFRKSAEMRYKLMPYIYAQARESTEKGLPMLRALFIEYPDDPTAWTIDDQYMFGSDMLVAPLLSDAESRKVYLPEGSWIDYQTGKTYSQGWHTIAHGDVPIVVLVKEGSAIPHIQLAQSTKFMDWSQLEMVTFSNEKSETGGKVFLPDGKQLHEIVITHQGDKISLSENPLGNTVDIEVTPFQQFD